MPDQMISNSQIIGAYREKTPGSEKLSMEANDVLPSGIAHDSRYLKPYALYIDKAQGPHKWDVDGNRYVDYFGDHGALLLGHCHPEVTKAVQNALAAGTQFGANHPKEVEWANQVIKMSQIIHASPKVRKFARQLGADISQLKGSERNGRITEDDVRNFIKN